MVCAARQQIARNIVDLSPPPPEEFKRLYSPLSSEGKSVTT
jgi:hypothetical protein